MALRAASETEPSLGRNAGPKSRSNLKRRTDTDSFGGMDSPGPSEGNKLQRLKGSSQRSSSVGNSQRDLVTVKIEEGAEGNKGQIAERTGLLGVGAEVVYRHKKGSNQEGEGMQCVILSITGDGQKKKYVFLHLKINPFSTLY